MAESERIISDLKDEIASKKSQRKSILSQLALVDVRIDNYDTIIGNIDKEALTLISPMNASISGVANAYDNVISSGCKTDLAWVEVKNWTQTVIEGVNIYPDVQYRTYKVKRDPNRRQELPLYGIKYYRAPLNRDYGAAVVADFFGQISFGSTVIAVTDEEGIPIEIQIGDTITDSLDSPQAFDASDLPLVTGFGQTSSVGILTTLIGGIPNGSNIFAHFGAGSTDGITPGMILSLPNILQEDSTITGFGTTDVDIDFFDSGGTLQTGTLTVTSIILDKPAIDTLDEGEVTVGVVTTSPAIFISTSSLDTVVSNLFTAIRVNNLNDIDKDFDPLKNPNAPWKIGIVDSSTLGIGTLALYDNSGFPSERQSYNPNKTYVDTRYTSKKECLFKNDGTPRANTKWDGGSKECIKKPEPDVGAGAAVYYDGSDQWPILNTPQVDGGGNITGYTATYASLGDEVTVSDISTEGPSIGYVSIPPGGVCSSSVLNQLANDITTATNFSSDLVNQNSSKASSLVKNTKALRRQRSEIEKFAWSLLQAAASLRNDIELLELELNQLLSIDLKKFE